MIEHERVCEQMASYLEEYSAEPTSHKARCHLLPLFKAVIVVIDELIPEDESSTKMGNTS